VRLALASSPPRRRDARDGRAPESDV